MVEFLTTFWEIILSVSNKLLDAAFTFMTSSPDAVNSKSWTMVKSLDVVFVAVACSLTALLFLISFCSNCIDIKQDMRPEVLVKLFIKVAVTEYFVSNSLDILSALIKSANGLVSLIVSGVRGSDAVSIKALGYLIQKNGWSAAIINSSDQIKTAAENMDIIPQIFYTLFVCVAGVVVVGVALSLFIIAVKRYVKILLAICYGSFAFATMAGGNSAISSTLPTFIKYFLGILLEGASFVMSMYIAVCFTGNGNGLIGSNGAVEIFATYADGMSGGFQVLFNIILSYIFVMTVVKLSQELAQKALGLGG